MIRIESASVTYRTHDEEREALRAVDLEVAPGRLIALVGANGSGKSTLARLCDGLQSPTSGRVTVDGIDTADESRLWEVRSRVGLVFQNPDNQIVGTVVEEDVAFGPENLGVPREEIRRRVSEALAEVGLSGFERREPHLLSEGQKQRLAIASALALEPAYLVLDEPTAMLDPLGRAEVHALVARLAAAGRGVLHISHDLAALARADQAVVLHEGRISYDGPPHALLADGRLLSEARLRVPSIARLAARLRALGLRVPADALSAESVVNALWP